VTSVLIYSRWIYGLFFRLMGEEATCLLRCAAVSVRNNAVYGSFWQGSSKKSLATVQYTLYQKRP